MDTKNAERHEHLHEPDGSYSLPSALGTALVKNLSAMQIYAEMPDAERRAFVDGARGISSSAELKKYVKTLKIKGKY